ncbi:MAG: methylated-DNA--[protein]-cysteine S-methyltransferase [Actinomycetaceae bacterium]|nr:methylated-DNA--[protein]-cysteine S-methyltransferase [Actinomycetaceae bacterium]
MILRHTLTVTPLGDLTLVALGEDLVGVYFPQHHPAPKPEALGIWVSPADSTLSDAADQIHQYLAGERTRFSIPFALPDAGFRSEVWGYLQTIPFGEVTTYSKIAEGVGRPRAYRAVGSAVGSNPLSIVVPCHRVIAADGSLSGYAGGVERKRRLLQMEYRAAKRLGLKSAEPDLFSGF